MSFWPLTKIFESEIRKAHDRKVDDKHVQRKIFSAIMSQYFGVTLQFRFLFQFL
jgi:hypothetical protein